VRNKEQAGAGCTVQGVPSWTVRFSTVDVPSGRAIVAASAATVALPGS
jgi:hypothetical protein